MQSIEKEFETRMSDPKFAVWYESRPERIQQLVRDYPYETYKVKPGAPYAITCPGSIVHLVAYSENGDIRVRLMAKDKLPDSLHNQKKLMHGKPSDHVARILSSNIDAHIKPEWLEPCEE